MANPYNNPVRAGYSFGIADLLNGAPRAAADDNYNQFDPFPIGHTGEVNDRDFFDSAGGLMLPVDRMRRFVTPVDIDGSGLALRWGVPWPAGDVGADALRAGRLRRLFPTPRRPGLISVDPGSGATPGAIVYPSASNDLFYTGGPNPANLAFPSYLPDVTNNPLHGFEAAKNPNLPDANGGYAPQGNGGMPADQNVAAGIPVAYPTYDLSIRTNGLNEADEMNLYRPNALMDSPFGPADLEWLYRSQDVDGTSLSSRLANLAPVSFTNTIDGLRRRRLFAVESWESNQFVWANDNPQNAFPFNSRFTPTANASFATASTALGSYVAAPSLAHHDRKINLNYPLPVSNDPDELIRRKWISDTYQLLKWVLPPRAVDTPEELAQLSQFVINIIDFRDPDCTMTHWQNPDVLLVPGQPANPSGSAPTPATAPTLVLASSNPANAIPLDQYGMEYNPVALNEVLAFSYAYYQGVGGAQANRFFVELVNTLTQSAFAALPPPAGGGTNPPDPSILDLGGFQYTPGDPYSGGCWDLVFTDDTPNSRPDPYRGELVQGGQFYALIPLNKDSFTASAAGAAAGSSSSPGSDVTLVPLGPAGVPLPAAGNPAATPPTPPTNFFYAFGNSPSNPAFETGTPSPTTYYPAGNGIAANTPSLVQYLSPAADPFNGAGDAQDHLVRGRAAGGRRGLRHLHGGRAAQLSVEAPHRDRGQPADEVLLGLPAPARQPVRPRVRGQSHAGRRRHALPLHRRHRTTDWPGSHGRTGDGPQPDPDRTAGRQHGLFGPAVPALSRRPRRPRRTGHTGWRSCRAADAGCPLRLHRADRGADGIFQSAGDPGGLLHRLDEREPDALLLDQPDLPHPGDRQRPG